MDMATTVLCLVAVVLGFGVLVFALYRKGDVRAGARVGGSSFFIEVKEPKHKG